MESMADLIKWGLRELFMKYFNIVLSLMIKSRRKRWAGHVARIGGEECIWDIGGKARRKELTRKTKM
jgi:hypothetical protein